MSRKHRQGTDKCKNKTFTCSLKLTNELNHGWNLSVEGTYGRFQGS